MRLILYKLLQNNKCFFEALIWTFLASDIQAHPLFQKIMNNLFSLKSLPENKNFRLGYSAILLAFWSSKVSFFGIQCPFHFIIYCYNIFVYWNNISSLRHCHAIVWNCFLLMVTMFIKLLLRACSLNVCSDFIRGYITVSYPDIFLYSWISMGAQIKSPNYLEQGLSKYLKPG